MLFFDEGLDATDRANKTALLLVRERYDAQLGKFVGNKPARLSYVGKQIERMIDEICADTQAEKDYVATRFNSYLESRLAAEGYNIKFVEGDAPDTENIQKDDVTRPSGEVEGAGLEDALNPPSLNKEDLYRQGAYTAADAGDPSDESTWKSCFRCEAKLNPVYAQSSPVCRECTDALTKQAWGDEVGINDSMGMGTGVGDPNAEADIMPAQPGQQFRCALCGAQGTHEEMLSHVQGQHSDVLQRQQEQLRQQPAPLASTQTGDTKTADEADGQEEPAKVEPLPQTPAGEFDDMVQDLAERAAAQWFSRPDPNTIHTMASQLGIDESQIQQNLVSIAIFGNYVGRNGELADDAAPPQGWEEVSQDVSGQHIDAQEALIPTDVVVSKVAEQQNMDTQLAYNMIRDHYGGEDLPEQFHASVRGEHHLYLPTELAGNQQQAPQEEQPVQNYDPNTGPAAPPAPQPDQQLQPQF